MGSSGGSEERLRRVVLERLIRYYRYLSELTAGKTVEIVTSAHLGEALDIDPTQVRKDFGAIGLMGISRVGYEVCEICRAIRFVFGFDQTYPAVLVGAGHLGRALLAYHGFGRYGLRIVAAFDRDSEKVGTEVGGVRVRPVRGVRQYVEKNAIQMAILTTPARESQALTERLVSAGVRAVWNFSPTRLTAGPDVLIRNEHISIGLAQLAYHLNQPEMTGAGSHPGRSLPTLDGPCAEPCPPSES